MLRNNLIEVRQAGEKDKKALFDFISVAWKNRALYQIPRRWKWLYEDNPFKKDERLPIWIALDGNRVVGHTAAMIVPLKVGEKVYNVAWSINTIVLSEYRGRGLGYELQKANQEAVKIFMSLSMTQANRRIKARLGAVPGPVVSNFFLRLRWVSQKVKESLQERFENKGFLGKLLFQILYIYQIDKIITLVENIQLKAVSFAVSSSTGKIEAPKDIAIKEIDRFRPEIDPILESFLEEFKVSVVRTSRYLNWKFVDQPHIKYRIFIAEVDSKIAGYMMIRTGKQPLENHYGVILDIVSSPNDARIISSLLWFAIKQLQKEKAEGIIISTTVSAVEQALYKFGFKKTSETVPMVYCSDDIPDKEILVDGSGWLLSRGDHDWDQFPSRM